MSPPSSRLSQRSVDELVGLYEATALQQDWSFTNADLKKYNREFKKLALIEDELRSRPGDQREALAILLNHPKAWVRICAARSTYSLKPARSRMHMQYVAENRGMDRHAPAGLAMTALVQSREASWSRVSILNSASWAVIARSEATWRSMVVSCCMHAGEPQHGSPRPYGARDDGAGPESRGLMVSRQHSG